MRIMEKKMETIQKKGFRVYGLPGPAVSSTTRWLKVSGI